MSDSEFERGGHSCPAFSTGSDADDYFDLLPDYLIQLVFNKIADIKALGRCCAVSKRFNSLVSQVENVVVKVDCVISDEDSSLDVKGKGFFSQLLRCVLGSLVKPLQALQHLLGPKKPSLTETSGAHHSPGEVLRNFTGIRHLCIELPGGELGIEQGVLIKWRAEFGSALESCLILGASSVNPPGKQSRGELNSTVVQEEEDNNGGSIPESFYTNGGLKLRVVWIISSLIAASARHYLLHQIVFVHPTLESLVLTDADGQGTLCMNKSQLEEFRRKPLAASASSNRTQVPPLNMNLWYAPHLELPDGTHMQGATLVAIRPSDRPTIKENDELMAAAFDEPFQSAVTTLAKRRTYLLEMNSF